MDDLSDLLSDVILGDDFMTFPLHFPLYFT